MSVTEGIVKNESIQQPFCISSMRSRVRSYIEKHHYDSAIFWADKLVAVSDAVEDIFWYAQTMYYTGQYHRAIHLLTSRKLDKTYTACRYLTAKCHFECKEYQEALDVLDMLDMSFSRSQSILNTSLNDSVQQTDNHFSMPNYENSVCLLRGKIYEAMDNRILAADCYREALRLDVYCFEAFDLLVNHHMLTAQEEHDLLQSLPFSELSPPEEAEVVRSLYESRLKKYDCPAKTTLLSALVPLSNSLDIIVSTAERHLYNCDFRAAYKITSKVLSKDPYNSQCLPIHIAILVELKNSHALFYLAHKLVDYYPDKSISWFAIGCYYMLTENFIPARWFLSKATTIERAHGPSWLAFGHTFGVNKDHDQAMAAYFTASQIMKGCHLPMLYIGLEYGLTNNPKLAERFFKQAHSIAPQDPFVLHEMGVLEFSNSKYEEAEKYFLEALNRIRSVCGEMLPERWEPLLNNLGHVSRKLGKYEDALCYHSQADALCPQTASTYSAIGYVHALMGNYSEAVNYFHKISSLKKKVNTAKSTFRNTIFQVGLTRSVLISLEHIIFCAAIYDYDIQAMVMETISSLPFVPERILSIQSAEVWTKIDVKQTALGLRKDDTFSTTMLTNSVDMLMSEVTVCNELEGDPHFPSSREGQLGGAKLTDLFDSSQKEKSIDGSKTDLEVTDNDPFAESSLSIEEVDMEECSTS